MTESKIKIVIDAMGGDYAPLNIILGARDALIESKHRFDIILSGPKDLLLKELKKNNIDANMFKILDAPERIDMHDSPTTILRTKKNSSLLLGLTKLKEKEYDAFLSAGNTGAVLAGATLIVGRIKNISRPTIGVFLPGVKHPVLVTDAGANVDCKPQFLYEFALMSAVFVKNILNIDNPSIGLLTIGEERSKGNLLIADTHELLANSKLNFIGNIEGSDILQNKVDVVITDGFTGNVVLKFGESLIPVLKAKFLNYASKSIFHKIWIGLVAKTVKGILRSFDYQNSGGVPLLGVKEVVIIGHGKSSPLAIKNMIYRAEEMVLNKIIKKIETALESINSQDQIPN